MEGAMEDALILYLGLVCFPSPSICRYLFLFPIHLNPPNHTLSSTFVIPSFPHYPIHSPIIPSIPYLYSPFDRVRANSAQGSIREVPSVQLIVGLLSCCCSRNIPFPSFVSPLFSTFLFSCSRLQSFSFSLKLSSFFFLHWLVGRVRDPGVL